MKKIIMVVTIVVIVVTGLGRGENEPALGNWNIDKKIEDNVRILSDKNNSHRKKDEVRLEIKNYGRKAIPTLNKLLNSEDSKIRFESLFMLLEIEGKKDEIFQKAIEDKYSINQVVPLLWLNAREHLSAKDREYRKWQKKIEFNFNETKFKELTKIVEQGKYLYDKKIKYNGIKEKEYDSWYATQYLIAMDIKAYSLIKERLKENPNSILWQSFEGIAFNHPEDKYGLDFLIELLNVNIKKLTHMKKSEKEIGRELVTPARYIYLIASQHAGIFTVSDIEKLELFLAPMKGKNIFLLMGTSDNMYSVIDHALQKIDMRKK